MTKPKKELKLWDGIDESHFNNEYKNVEDVDIADYDKENMTLFAANVNLMRQIIRLSDSLKPVERRILYALYLNKAFPGHKLKSTMIGGLTAIYHCHGDSYPSLVGMAQGWKKQCPLIDGKGNFGNAARPDMFAASRYTEASMSMYAKECFFDDYDKDCVETVFNSTSDMDEPMSLPAKFPNILINGGMGIAFGNAFRIPTYNIHDVIRVCKDVIIDPLRANVYMIPDLPSGCQIIDDGENFKDIINTGKGVLKMRANAEIIETPRNWIIKITSLPWMVSLSTIEDKIVKLAEEGQLTIKDKQDHSYAIKNKNGVETKVDFRLIVDKVHDPYAILNKLYTNTDLQKSVSVDFKVVLDELKVKRLNMRDLIMSWLDERRSYKRRLFNKRLTKVSARIALLEILLYLLKENNIENTIKIIKNSNTDEVVAQLMKLTSMTSYQATRIAEMRLNAFTKDARERYKQERSNLLDEKKRLMNIIQSEDKIDEIIMHELDDLNKYATPRRSEIVAEDTGRKISNTMHTIVVSNNGYIKKLPVDNKNKRFGAYKTGDYPIKALVVHNTKTVTFIDSFGRYTNIPVYDIDTTDYSSYGVKAYDLTKLSGKIVQVLESYDDDNLKELSEKYGKIMLVSISKNGYAKKTPMEDFQNLKNNKNVRIMKLRDGDSLVTAQAMFDYGSLIIYTKKGNYAIYDIDEIVEQNKDSMGLITMRVDADDSVVDFKTVSHEDDYIVIVTEKGMIKKVPYNLFAKSARRGNIKDQGSLITLDQTDSVYYAGGMNKGEELVIITKGDFTVILEEDIPEYTKKAKGKKLINTAMFNITGVFVREGEDKK